MNPEEHPHYDPLIDEVRQRRQELLAECDNDLQKLYEAIRRRQDEHPEKVAAPRGQRPRIR